MSDAQTSGALAPSFASNPQLVFKDETEYGKLVETISAEIKALNPDVSTAKGRDAIKSLAYKITRTKTALDDAGKGLNEDAQALIKKVNERRNEIKERLATMAEEARKPLTDWEKAEKDREELARNIENEIHTLSVVREGEASEGVADRITRLDAIKVTFEIFGDEFGTVQTTKAKIRATLESTLVRVKQHEADQAELAKLREEARLRAEADAAREAADRARAEAAELRRRKDEEDAAAAKAEEERAARETAERIAREEQIAEAARVKADQEAKAAADEELRRVEAEKQAQINKLAAEKAALEKQEADRIEAETAAKAKADRLAADQAHRSAVIAAVANSITEHSGAPRDLAERIAALAAAGAIQSLMVVF